MQANSDLGSLPFYTHANFSRGTASGGGLYPIGIHWVCGPSGPFTPGVYHYATGHHAMERLLTGDVSAEVRAALGTAPRGPSELDWQTDQFLVLGVKFWQNAFKYNSFSYHVVAMDIGALLETWRIWARAHGLHIGAALWFDEARLTRLLGMASEEEGVFAVVPLRWRQDGAAGDRAGSAPVAARVRGVDQERSRTVLDFETVRRVHAATLAGATDRPAPGVLAGALASEDTGDGDTGGGDTGGGQPCGRYGPQLPEPQPLTTGVRTALRARRSSFGRFTAEPPISAAQLATALAAAATTACLDTDAETGLATADAETEFADAETGLAAGADGPPLTRLYVFVNHVADIPPGAYAYLQDGPRAALRPLHSGAPGAFLQRNYFLANYNLEQAGAVIAVAAPTAAVLDAVGDRGLRLVNAAVGACSQALYTATAAAGLACGVALGFDCVSYAEELGLSERGEVPMLIMMVGQEHRSPADFDHRIA